MSLKLHWMSIGFFWSVVFTQRVPYYDIVIINLLFSFFTAMNTSFNLNSFAVKATLRRQS